jgi:hypothetical protein
MTDLQRTLIEDEAAQRRAEASARWRASWITDEEIDGLFAATAARQDTEAKPKKLTRRSRV